MWASLASLFTSDTSTMRLAFGQRDFVGCFNFVLDCLKSLAVLIGLPGFIFPGQVDGLVKTCKIISLSHDSTDS